MVAALKKRGSYLTETQLIAMLYLGKIGQLEDILVILFLEQVLQIGREILRLRRRELSQVLHRTVSLIQFEIRAQPMECKSGFI